MFTATYSPEDDKLRIYASSRLDSETYERVKAAGFRWAPAQKLFFAVWTPARRDLAESLAGEIEDEDKSLVERAEERAERFEEYSENRAGDAERAREAVAAIADNIPLGQPILIGHHSERRARRDAEKIQNGMRRAVRMWETSKYWTQRAVGAKQHAKYKQLPAVRERRIKGLEADLRRVQRNYDRAEKFLAMWNAPGLTLERAISIANYDHLSFSFTLDKYPRALPASQYEGPMSFYSALEGGIIDAEQARAIAVPTHEDCMSRYREWITHYTNRIEYERAMLDEQGGAVADRWRFEVGGRILRRGEWLVIAKVNRESVSVFGHWSSTVPHNEIKDYRPPTAEETAKVRKIAKTPPLCNYPGEGFVHMTRAELDARPERRWSDFGKTLRMPKTDAHGAHRVPCSRGAKSFSRVGVFVTDEKRKDPPPPDRPVDVDTSPKRGEYGEGRYELAPKPAGSETFEAMRESLRVGVQVVSAPQLFPTPPDLARRVVELAELGPNLRILEPSAGTGRLVEAIRACRPNSPLMAVEINQALADALAERWRCIAVRCSDFLECNGDLGKFDRVIMNPPFERGADIRHIEHARRFLKPGGRLVAICANGPRQREALEPIAREWVDLPAGSFAAEGTNVSAAIVVIDAEDSAPTI